MNIHLSSSKNPIVTFRKKILNTKNAPVQDLFTECNNRHFRLSWFDPTDPVLHTYWKVMVTFHPTNRNLPGYIGFFLYIVSVPACPVTLTSVESNEPSNDPNNTLRRSIALSCDRRMFRNIFQHTKVSVLICLHHGYRL
jgi:hypothetical protein